MPLAGSMEPFLARSVFRCGSCGPPAASCKLEDCPSHSVPLRLVSALVNIITRSLGSPHRAPALRILDDDGGLHTCPYIRQLPQR